MRNLEPGSNIEFKELEDKIIVAAKNTTKIKEGNFLLEAEQIVIKAGVGISISSIGTDTLVISANHTKMEEGLYDLRKEVDERLKVIEQVFSQILKNAKK